MPGQYPTSKMFYLDSSENVSQYMLIKIFLWYKKMLRPLHALVYLKSNMSWIVVGGSVKYM